MAGLLSKAMQDMNAPPTEEPEAPPMEEQADAPDEETAVPGQEPATPEEEEALSRALTVASKIMTGKGGLDRLVASIKAQGVEKAIAQATVTIVEQVDRRLDLPETVILEFASEVAMFGFEVAARAKMVKAEDDKKLSAVMQELFKMLSTVYEFDPQESAQILTEMDQASGGRPSAMSPDAAPAPQGM